MPPKMRAFELTCAERMKLISLSRLIQCIRSSMLSDAKSHHE